MVAGLYPNFLKRTSDNDFTIVRRDLIEQNFPKYFPEQPVLLKPNTLLQGTKKDTYIVRHINSGGMSKVYEVRDDCGNKYAAKVLNKDLLKTTYEEHFEEEENLLQALQGDPFIISYIDSGKYGNQPFFIMELADDTCLKEIIENKLLSKKEILEIISSFLPTIDNFHKIGIIHRDLKPGNILMKNGNPQISDFGLAGSISNVAMVNKLASGKEINSNQTEIDGVIGTVQYMSPEQAKYALALNPNNKLQSSDLTFTEASDKYSLAAMVYEVLAGKPPILQNENENKESLLRRVAYESPVHINNYVPNINSHNNLGHTIMRLLDKNPEHRTTTIQELKKEIDDYAAKL